MSRAILSRFTFDPAIDMLPIWSPDGDHIVFTSARRGYFDLYQKASSGGAGKDELLLESSAMKWPDDWSPNGKFIIYSIRDPKTNVDLYVLPVSKSRLPREDQQPFPFLQTDFDEEQAKFSPDGRWLAYRSNESGIDDIYVRPFPASAAKWKISTSGGSQPRWRQDGKELFYIAPDSTLMSVDIHTSSTFEAGVPKALFKTGITSAIGTRYHYAVTGDGQRFLIITPVEQVSSPITVVTNWTAGMKR